MSSLLGRAGGAAARHPWRTIAAWLIVGVALLSLKMALGGQFNDDYTVPGAPSQSGADFLRAHFPQVSGTTARVLGFAADPNVTVKTIGVGMAVAVLIDATLVRLVLAPAAMVLIGRAGWWLPGAGTRWARPAARNERVDREPQRLS